MKRVVKPCRTVLLSVVTGLCLLILLHAAPAEAYEEDTHYHMTYILCRAVGFTEAEARTVARFDQGMDDSTATSATAGPGDTQPQILEEILWHAIPVLSKPADVLLRK